MAEKKTSKAAYSKELIIKGKVKFSTISEAKSFPTDDGGMTKPTYSLMILVDSDDPQLKTIQEEHEMGVKLEMARLTKAKQEDAAPKNKNNSVKSDTDKSKQETGLMAVTADRPESFGPPKVFDKNNQPVERKYLKMGTEVLMSVRLRSSNVSNRPQTKLGLEAIQILHEEEYVRQERTAESYGFKPLEDIEVSLGEDSPF